MTEEEPTESELATAIAELEPIAQVLLILRELVPKVTRNEEALALLAASEQARIEQYTALFRVLTKLAESKAVGPAVALLVLAMAAWVAAQIGLPLEDLARWLAPGR